jgi:alpha-tubulin suppressor-like RCC1 family protein
MLGSGDLNDRGDGPGEMGANLAFVDLGGALLVSRLSAGNTHVCAQFTTGTLKCWGSNEYGKLGYGDTQHRGDGSNEMGANLPFVDLGPGETVVRADCGSGHTCALLTSGGVKCWGYAEFGQLGYGDQENRGDGPGEMGANLSAVSLGAVTVVGVSLGAHFTCVWVSTGRVKCFGVNDVGQLGYGDTVNRGAAAGEMGASLAFVDLGVGETVQFVSAGSDSVCALLTSGGVKCWGTMGPGSWGTGTEGGAATVRARWART